jgi:hypothetical protein
MEIIKCKYCNSEFEKKGKNTMIGHFRGCVEYKKWKDEKFSYKFLYDEYITKGKSALQIANENGYPSSSAINKQIIKLNIPIRSVKQSHLMNGYKNRIEATNLEKYGAVNPLSKGTSSFKKRNKTVKDRYGVDNVWQAKCVKEKIKKSGAYKNIVPNYNINSISIIEQYGKENGYNFQHAENGGEFFVNGLGYYLDGYDVNKKVAIEIDESHHFDKNGKLGKKDIERQTKIEEFLGCKFIRIRYEN